MPERNLDYGRSWPAEFPRRRYEPDPDAEYERQRDEELDENDNS